ncbi:hypothetical protein Hokovirus_2_24 [Hokovirus HKV1]|uniref:Uncharacterized protein n=1 Tax=Hokovirus HKV1 TaxID=1977638 RepID=A0A1V0SFK6_9VIRU|nr:hypothetical protein Hokovirus_2_24 [Hokovirus HKV1]
MYINNNNKNYLYLGIIALLYYFRIINNILRYIYGHTYCFVAVRMLMSKRSEPLMALTITVLIALIIYFVIALVLGKILKIIDMAIKTYKHNQKHYIFDIVFISLLCYICIHNYKLIAELSNISFMFSETFLFPEIPSETYVIPGIELSIFWLKTIIDQPFKVFFILSSFINLIKNIFRFSFIGMLNIILFIILILLICGEIFVFVIMN